MDDDGHSCDFSDASDKRRDDTRLDEFEQSRRHVVTSFPTASRRMLPKTSPRTCRVAWASKARKTRTSPDAKVARRGPMSDMTKADITNVADSARQLLRVISTRLTFLKAGEVHGRVVVPEVARRHTKYPFTRMPDMIGKIAWDGCRSAVQSGTRDEWSDLRHFMGDRSHLGLRISDSESE